MDASAIAVFAAMILLTLCHALTLWLVYGGRDSVREYAASLQAATALIAEEMGEAGRIGSDIADTLDRVESGLAGIEVQEQTAPHGGLDLKGTAASLLTDFISSKIYATETEQERPVHLDQEETPPSDSSSSTEETPKQVR